ncbi:hypothetical protein FACS1894189_7530 [Planctomycetales bacterium]|nr:hypothetical protein FACS1894189_7530 [Planctomycetales bacterium]
MEISYKNSQIRKLCTDEKSARKLLGNNGAKRLSERLDQMLTVPSLDKLFGTAGDWHELKGNRKGQFACKITGSYRLVFEPNNDDYRKQDGGLDWSKIIAVMNIEIIDYH